MFRSVCFRCKILNRRYYSLNFFHFSHPPPTKTEGKNHRLMYETKKNPNILETNVRHKWTGPICWYLAEEPTSCDAVDELLTSLRATGHVHVCPGLVVPHDDRATKQSVWPAERVFIAGVPEPNVVEAARNEKRIRVGEGRGVNRL